MPRQARKTSGTGIYHVMLCGINRQDIFEDDEDYMKFLQSLHQLVECYDECGYAADIDALVRRRLLKFRDVKDEDDFDLPTAVIRCLKHNEVYELPRRTGLFFVGYIC